MKYDVEDTADCAGGSLTPASSTEETAEASVCDATTTPAPDSSKDSGAPPEKTTESSIENSAQEAVATKETENAQPDAADKPKPPPKPFPLPDWLLENCVTLRETWKDAPDTLETLQATSFDAETGLLTTAEAKRINAQDLASMPYAMDEILFTLLLNLFRPEEKRTGEDAAYFTDDVIILQSISNKLPGHRAKFIAAVVRQFAKMIGADLVRLGREDDRDFLENVWDDKEVSEGKTCTEMLFEDIMEAEPAASAAKDKAQLDADKAAGASKKLEEPVSPPVIKVCLAAPLRQRFF